MKNDVTKQVAQENHIELEGATYIVERSFCGKMTVMDLVAQRVINEKKKTDDAKRAAIDDIA